MSRPSGFWELQIIKPSQAKRISRSPLRAGNTWALSHEPATKEEELGRQIKRLGRDGWELVDVEVLPYGEGTKTVFYFKRPS